MAQPNSLTVGGRMLMHKLGLMPSSHSADYRGFEIVTFPISGDLFVVRDGKYLWCAQTIDGARAYVDTTLALEAEAAR